MKVLITTDWYCPAVNGVVTSVLNLTAELQREGHEVMILTLSPTHQTYQEGHVIYIGSLNMDRIYPTARVRMLFSKKWYQKIIDWHPDVIHSQCEVSTFGLAKRIGRELSIPIVHTYHTIYEDYTHYLISNREVGRAFVKRFSRIVCHSVDSVIAPTQKAADLLRSYDIHSKIDIIPTGLVLDKFHDSRAMARSQWSIPEDETLLIYLGRITKEKNIDELLQLLSNYRESPITLMIVGEGPHQEPLKVKAKQLPSNVRTIFTGLVAQEDVQAYYAMADLFVSASQSETQGLTYIEAGASGLPLLCKEDECLKQTLINDANGWQYQSDQDFLQKLSYFVHTTPEERATLGQRSKELAGQFDIRSTTPQVAEVYRNAIAQHVKSTYSPLKRVRDIF